MLRVFLTTSPSSYLLSVLFLDDELFYYHYLSSKFKNYKLILEQNPIAWLDKVYLEKIDINNYEYIFCDYNFDNISMNSIELKISKYIRELGYKNNLILFTNMVNIDEEEIKKTEFYDLIIEKHSNLSIESINKMCLDSSLSKSWKKRIH